jgi:hypothetical protein
MARRRATARWEGFDEALAFELGRVERAITGAMDEAVDGLKEDLRDQVRAAGLGERLAKTWRGERYPKGGESLEPAGWVWSRAPKIVAAFDAGATIVPKFGRFLAIPTDRVPFKSGSRGRRTRMNPEEVELAFDQDLTLRRGRGGSILGFVNVVRARSQRRPGWRKGTQRRLAQGRQLQIVLMFIFVPRVRQPKLLDLQTAADRWAARVPAAFDRRMGSG